jgi:hypothetical protein
MQSDERLFRLPYDVLISMRSGELSTCRLDLLPEADLLRLKDAAGGLGTGGGDRCGLLGSRGA